MANEKLFTITSFIKDYETETITVMVEPNNYTGSIIMIDFTEFKVYLDKYDRLYYETHDCSTGHYVYKAHNLTIEEYLMDVTYDNIVDDLYDYILAHCINWTTSMRRILMQSNNIISQTNYMA
jgi:hypothetical protein